MLHLGVDATRTIATGVDALKTRDQVMARALIEHDQELTRTRSDIEER